ncbi:MAG: serine hydrolase [Acidobacteria bacterium]|nr:serine hydrolase [Acidobacteriota bacterium]
MSCIQRVCIPIAVLLLASAARVSAQEITLVPPSEVGLSEDRLERINDVMEDYIEAKKVAGTITLVARAGEVAHLGVHGMQDVEAGKEMQPDTIFRIASMTKPITSVAVMMLFEEGKLLLTDPVSKYLPEFTDMRVLKEGSSEEIEPAKRPITIKHLLTHTSGLTYQWDPRLGNKYKAAGVSHGLIEDEKTIAKGVKALATLPLLHHPGDKFTYSLSIDVLGRLVEVWSGMTLDEFFQERIFDPLGMEDTSFFVPEEKVGRLAAVYARDEDGPIRRTGPGPQPGEHGMAHSVTYPYEGSKSYFSGGGGLLSTIRDYYRFAQMILNGGELEGERLLSRKTVELMTSDQVGDLQERGFGLGFSVERGPREFGGLGSIGTHGWGGFFYTSFFIDPEEELIGIYMSQLHPSGGLDLAEKFRVLAYQSIAD